MKSGFQPLTKYFMAAYKMKKSIKIIHEQRKFQIIYKIKVLLMIRYINIHYLLLTQT